MKSMNQNRNSFAVDNGGAGGYLGNSQSGQGPMFADNCSSVQNRDNTNQRPQTGSTNAMHKQQSDYIGSK